MIKCLTCFQIGGQGQSVLPSFEKKESDLEKVLTFAYGTGRFLTDIDARSFGIEKRYQATHKATFLSGRRRCFWTRTFGKVTRNTGRKKWA